MSSTEAALCGEYLGVKRVREGREVELSAKERKEIAKATPDVELRLRVDGTFQRQVTAGTWKVHGERVEFQPETFGGETLDQMRRRAEASGRAFGLAFIFNAFELVITATGLETVDDGGPLYTEFTRQ